MAEGLILKSSKKMRDKVLAQQIFKDMLSTKPTEFHTINFALYSLCDLMIEEVSVYGDEEVLIEVNELVDTIYDKAEAKNHPQFKIESKLLKSKFLLLRGDVDAAENLIYDSLKIAEEYGMDKQLERITQEEKILSNEKNLKELKEISGDHLTIQEKLKKIEIQSYLKNALKIIELG